MSKIIEPDPLPPLSYRLFLLLLFRHLEYWPCNQRESTTEAAVS